MCVYMSAFVDTLKGIHVLSEFMLILHRVNRPCESSQLMDDVLDFVEIVVMINSIDGSTQILDVIKVLLDDIKLMVPLYIVDRIAERLHLNDILLDLSEGMVPGLNIKDGANKISQCHHLLFNLIEVMVELPRSYRITRLLQNLHLLGKFIELMLSFNFVDWIV